MKKIYHLSGCSTCQRIIKNLSPANDVILQDIKKDKITPQELDYLAKLAGNYQALFSKIAMKYRQLGLNKKELSENDYRNYILEEYTFLKRPVIVVNDKIFIGSSKKNIEAAAKFLCS